MASVVDRPLELSDRAPTTPVAGWAAVAGGASLAAGAIHATAVGSHSEHQQAVFAFTVAAAVQIGLGVLALMRERRSLVVLLAVANAAFVAGWVTAKLWGLPFIDGLDAKEAIQTADGMAAGLAGGAVLAAALALRARRTLPSRSSAAIASVAVLATSLAIPGMIEASAHNHTAHDHTETVAAVGGPVAAVAPKPYDPSLPIDLGGVAGVTPQEQARAENLVSEAILRLPQFADASAVGTMGFVSIGDGALGHEHYLNPANMNDDRILDPSYPESLVYDTSVTPKRLAAAMFMMNPGDTLADVPEVGGKLTQWHVHDNLCFAGPRVAGLTNAQGLCGPGLTKGAQTPMIHVWIEPNPCGPFAALEGVAGGTIAAGEARLCDHAHGA